MAERKTIVIDDTPIDTLTVKFWRDGNLAKKPHDKNTPWACHVGENFIEGAGGFGKTPLIALADLAVNIGRDEGVKTDNGKIFIR